MTGWIDHRPARVRWAPWRTRCACGAPSYPCDGQRIQWAQQRIDEARAWRDYQRRRYAERSGADVSGK